MTESEIIEFLAAERLTHGPVDIKRMAGGYWNHVLRIKAGSERLIVKHFAPVMDGTLFPNLPDDEARALQRLAGCRVAPDFIGFWPRQSILVYRYVEGTTWEGDVRTVADLLLRKEHADPTGFRRVPLGLEAILKAGDAMFGRCRTSPDVRRPSVSEIGPPSRTSLIHTDIGANNLIGDGEALRLIDWQCPAEGDLCEDVFSFLSPAFQILSEKPPLADTQIADFFDALHREDVKKRYIKIRPAFAWRMAAYCRLRSEIADDEVVRARYRSAEQAELNAIEMEAPL